VRINVLGPMELVDGERCVSPGGPGPRAVLAALALGQHEVVAVGRLAQLLWAGPPPATARTKIQAHVSALRQAMGFGPGDADSPLLTVPPGYQLAEEAVLDLAEFDALMTRGVAAAETGNAAAASGLLGTALAQWRGTAFTGVGAVPIRAAADALDDRRMVATDLKAQADLDLGRYAMVVTELSPLVFAHPLRERTRGLCMLALNEFGGRAEALRLYESGREILRRELGIEPGPWLRGLREQILAGDPVDVHSGGRAA
jgi:DNA-binding SARP family transcriptional activator